MPRYEITSPDGRRFEVTAPAGATKEQVLAYAQQNFTPKTARKPHNPLDAVGGEIVGAVSGAWDNLKRGVSEDYQASRDRLAGKTGPDPVGSMARTGRLVGDVGALALSPISGLNEGVVVKPLASVLNRIPMTAYTQPTARFENGRLTIDNGRPMTPEEKAKWTQDTVRTATSAAKPGAPRQNPLATIATTPTPKPTMADTVAQFDRAGVDPSLAAVRGRGAAGTANAIAENPVGGNVRRRFAANVEQAGTKAGQIASGYGTPTSTVTLGENAQAGTKTFMQGKGAAVPNPRAAPSSKVTFGDKAEGLYRRAEAAVGAPDAPIDLVNTQRALADATASFSDPNLSARFSNSVVQGIAEDIQAAGGRLSWSDASKLRSKIRTRLLKDPQLRGTVDDAAVSRIYGALTDDLEAGASALGGPGAARAWQQANRFYRAGVERQAKALDSVFGAGSGEKAYDQIVSAASSGARADVRKISAVKRSLPPEQWGDIAATVIDRMGRPTAGAANAVDGEAFSVSTFLTNYAKLSPQGREILFGSLGGGGQGATALKGELDNLAQVVARLKDVEKGANVSKSGVSLQNTGTTAAVGGGIAAAAMGNPAPLVGVTGGLAGMRLTGEMLTNPAAVRWLSKLAQASARGPGAVRAQTAALSRAARTNAALQPLAAAVQQSSGLPTAAGSAAAEPQERP